MRTRIVQEDRRGEDLVAGPEGERRTAHVQVHPLRHRAPKHEGHRRVHAQGLHDGVPEVVRVALAVAHLARCGDDEGEGRRGKASEKAREGKARRGKARQGKGRQGKAREGKARQGKARQGEGRQGKGKAREGKARARRGKAREAHLIEERWLAVDMGRCPEDAG